MNRHELFSRRGAPALDRPYEFHLGSRERQYPGCGLIVDAASACGIRHAGLPGEALLERDL